MDHTTATEHRRLAILRHLDALPQFSSNASIIRDVLAGVGVPSSEDQLRQALAWLEEMGLVRLRHAEEVTIAEITGRGSEVARGEALAPGVAGPRPRG
jgi:hypothetical protein